MEAATTYEVGPSKPLSSIGSVPWETLQPGDTVLIHYRPNAYAEKFVICRQGTTNAPITVRGVPGPNGELPILDGNAATTRTNLNYWGENRAVIKIGGASKPVDTMPRFVTIENLDVRSARPPFSFTGANKTVQNYAANAASIWIEKGENITIRNCVIRDSGNGFFVSSSDTDVSKSVLVEGCYIFGNGNTNSIYEHNVYTAASGITYQFNRFGPLRSGCSGNNLKDRSAGLVVRFNWIEGGNRELDLVDAEDSSILRNDPAYRKTFVYGNVIFEPNADGNKQLIHYGGDSGTTANYRKGTLHFYNNTVVSKRPDQTTMFRLSTNEEEVDARNNIFYSTNSGNSFALLDADGILRLSHNWIKTGWKSSFSTLTGTIVNDGTMLTGTIPGFLNMAANDFHLMQTSTCVNASGTLSTNTANFPISSQYVMHQSGQTRPIVGVSDLGAFEFATPIDIWRTEHFGSSTNNSISSDPADPDGDGVPNLLEYAFGTSPQTRTTTNLPHATRMTTNGNDFVALEFTAIPAPSGLIYTVQSSGDLNNWTNEWRNNNGTITNSPNIIDLTSTDPSKKVIRLSSPISNTEQKFLRLVVERSE